MLYFAIVSVYLCVYVKTKKKDVLLLNIDMTLNNIISELLSLLQVSRCLKPLHLRSTNVFIVMFNWF